MNDNKKNQKLYHIEFTGGFHPQVSEADAITAFAKLFSIDHQKAQAILAKPCIIKKDLDQKSVIKYLQALENTGVMTEIKPPIEETENNSANKQATSLELLPKGSDILTTQERANSPITEIDTSHIKMTSVFLTSETSDNKHIESVNIPNLSIADVGEELLVVKPKKASTTTVNSDFELTPIGSDLLDEHEKEKAHTQHHDISHLSIES